MHLIVMKLDLSDVAKICGTILMLLAIIFGIINYQMKGFSFRIIWFAIIFIVGLVALLSGFTFLRRDSIWRKKRGI